MQAPILTHHARQRSQQRSITSEVLSAILRKGSRTHYKNVVICQLNKGRETRYDGQRGQLVAILDREESCVITLWKKLPPHKRPTRKGRAQTYQRVHWPQNQLLGQFSPEDWEDELAA